jgi:hypothetical protein
MELRFLDGAHARPVEKKAGVSSSGHCHNLAAVELLKHLPTAAHG